jgi:endonuclease YncB( thermonuclease family)
LFLTRVALSLALVVGGANAGCAGERDDTVIAGRASVVDGDGVEIDGTKIRLFGIDAMETGQYCRRADGSRWRCGQYATVALDRLAGGREIRCNVRAVDRYDRPVAVCRVGDVDLGAEQVKNGWAVAYRRFSKDYVDQEQAAKQARAGAWAGTFEMPWDWRHRTSSAASRP